MNRQNVSGQYLLLTKHFFGRFFDFEAISANQIDPVEKNALIIKILALLILPGVAKCIFLFPYYSYYLWRSTVERDLATLTDKCFFLALSMILVGFLTVFEWETLFPDRKDYLILTPMPISTRDVFLAKICALALFLLTFTIALDIGPTVLFPGAVLIRGTPLWQGVRYTASHAISSLLGNAFMMFSAIALQGVLLMALPQRSSQIISRCIRFACLIILLCTLISIPTISSVDRLIQNSSPITVFFPPLWFTGIYEVLLGSRDPAILRLAGRAIAALALTGALAILAYAACYRRFARKIAESSAGIAYKVAGIRKAGNFVLDRWFIRKPESRALFHFVGQTIFRSPRHSLYFAAFLAVGFSIAAMQLRKTAYSDDPSAALNLYKEILSIPPIISFILLAGIRATFAIPADLPANWLFQLAPKQQVQSSHAGVRKFLIGAVILPIFAFTAIFYTLIWNGQMILLHVCFGLILALTLMELLFYRYPKMPFTCSYLPGAAFTIFQWPFYILGFIGYVYASARLEAWLSDGIFKFVCFLGIAGILLLVLAIRNYRSAGNAVRFVEESEASPVFLDMRK